MGLTDTQKTMVQKTTRSERKEEVELIERGDFNGEQNTCSQVAAPILPVADPAMLITVNFFYGNVFYIVRRAKLAWLHLVQP